MNLKRQIENRLTELGVSRYYIQTHCNNISRFIKGERILHIRRVKFQGVNDIQGIQFVPVKKGHQLEGELKKFGGGLL